MDNQVKVALWCVPRTMSTVLAKCLSAIDEMEVYLELYSYAATASGIFKTATGRELPTKLEGNETAYEMAQDMWKEATKSCLIPERISSYDIQRSLENTNSKYVFIKEMTFILDYVKVYMPRGFRYAFLIREPSRVYVSYRKGRLSSGFDLQEEELDIVQNDPVHQEPMTWYEKQHQLWKYVQENLDPNPVIIDAFDLCSHPEKILKGFCDAVGYPFSNRLLQWSPSTEFPKNFITAGEDLFDQFAVFYSTAFRSTEFMAPAESGPIPRDQLTNDVLRCVDHSMPFYRDMYRKRLLPS